MTIICTLFEGDYHFGVAALINSAVTNGFKGDFIVGYKGIIPKSFEVNSKISKRFHWPGEVYILSIPSGNNIFFVKAGTDTHLAHYKPKFMLEIMETLTPTSIAYFDPDIVIKCDWNFFEKWMVHGVAMVHEIVSNDMPPSHPTRKEWESVIKSCGKTITNSLYSYLNCGFCGVTETNFSFLELWSFYIETAISEYHQDPNSFTSTDRTNLFWSIDQDTFNMAAMSCSNETSEMGPEAMDFTNGGWTMSHATGSPKPWQKNFLLAILTKGVSPSLAEKNYWKNVDHPIRLMPKYKIFLKRKSITIASFISRFYRRN